MAEGESLTVNSLSFQVIDFIDSEDPPSCNPASASEPPQLPTKSSHSAKFDSRATRHPRSRFHHAWECNRRGARHRGRASKKSAHRCVRRQRLRWRCYVPRERTDAQNGELNWLTFHALNPLAPLWHRDSWRRPTGLAPASRERRPDPRPRRAGW